MTTKEKLLLEIECAINATFGDLADKEFTEESVTEGDLVEIARKTAFYMDLR